VQHSIRAGFAACPLNRFHDLDKWAIAPQDRSTYYPAEVVTRRTIIEHSAVPYVLADSTKLGAIGLHRVCPLDRIAAVITDYAGDSGAAAALASAGVTLLRAESLQLTPR